MIYLDNSATTRQYDEVTQEMIEFMRNDFGNPSSLYGAGLTAERAVKNARKKVAEAMGCKADEIIFTSGGTEADNMAIFGAAEARKRIGKKIITSSVEHPAVNMAMERLEKNGFRVVRIGADDKCRLDMEQLKRELDDDVVLISVMSVNNETGTVQPVFEIAELVNEFNKKHRDRNTGIIFHTDAVQAFGKLASVRKMADAGVHMISVSAHKIHGPKGTGAIYISKDISVPPFIVGGGQERGMRSGTENVPAIVGFGKACEIMQKGFDEHAEQISKVRTVLLNGIREKIEDVKVNGIEELTDEVCPSVLNVSFIGTRGEVILHSLESEGICVSTGSACSSKKKGSHVLKAMKCSEKEIESAIRFSFSHLNTVDEMNMTAEKVAEAVTRFRRLGSFR